MIKLCRLSERAFVIVVSWPAVEMDGA